MSVNALNDYVKHIDSIKPLTKEEESILINKMIDGDESAKEAMIHNNLKLVIKIAHEFKGYGVPLEDLISVGNIGLMNAVNKYKTGKGSKFDYYASLWIRAKIRKELCKSSNVIGMAQSTYIKMKQAQKLSDDEMNIEEIAKEMKTRNKQYILGLVEGLSQCSLSDTISDTDKLTIGDTIEDYKGNFINKMMIQEDLKHVISNAKKVLNATEYFVIEHRFGLNDKTPMKQTEISKLMNLTNSRVQQIEKNATSKLKQFYNT